MFGIFIGHVTVFYNFVKIHCWKLLKHVTRVANGVSRKAERLQTAQACSLVLLHKLSIMKYDSLISAHVEYSQNDT